MVRVMVPEPAAVPSPPAVRRATGLLRSCSTVMWALLREMTAVEEQVSMRARMQVASRCWLVAAGCPMTRVWWPSGPRVRTRGTKRRWRSGMWGRRGRAVGCRGARERCRWGE